MDESNLLQQLQEIRETQKAQAELLRKLQASISAQNQDLLTEKTKWMQSREALLQEHLHIQTRKVRAQQWVRLYLLILIFAVAAVYMYRLRAG